MSTNVDNNTGTAKKFIPTQVGIHNKAIDVLTLLQKCQFKITEIKRQIANVDVDHDLIPPYYADQHRDIRANLVMLYNQKINVYRRIMRSYRDLLLAAGDGVLAHKIDFMPQEPAALENGVAA